MSDLSTISSIWNIIVTSNTFNFIVFVLILAWVAKKINVSQKISDLQEKIIKLINEAKAEKAKAEEDLLGAEKTVENLPAELNEIMQDAEKSAQIISKKILSEAEKQVESIEANAVKVIDAEEKLLIANLTKNTSLASVEVAKNHIKNVLLETPTLHEKYINESINEIDRLKF